MLYYYIYTCRNDIHENESDDETTEKQESVYYNSKPPSDQTGQFSNLLLHTK